MSKIVQFGENVEGYNIPVLNEREIRAAAGILFLFMFISAQVFHPLQSSRGANRQPIYHPALNR